VRLRAGKEQTSQVNSHAKFSPHHYHSCLEFVFIANVRGGTDLGTPSFIGTGEVLGQPRLGLVS
jgi:hypothetical protein